MAATAATAPLMVTAPENAVLKAILGVLVPILTQESSTVETFIDHELDLGEAEIITLLKAKFGPLVTLAQPELDSLKAQLETYIANEIATGIAAAKAAS